MEIQFQFIAFHYTYTHTQFDRASEKKTGTPAKMNWSIFAHAIVIELEKAKKKWHERDDERE